MEDILVPQKPTLEQKLEWQYKEKRRELHIARMRASVVRNQVVEAYEHIENIRFDYVSDTAFRDKITQAKKGLESALGDFLLSDGYWEKRIEDHRHLTPQEFDDLLKNPAYPTESKVVAK